jgi:hypothetical protein
MSTSGDKDFEVRKQAAAMEEHAGRISGTVNGLAARELIEFGDPAMMSSYERRERVVMSAAFTDDTAANIYIVRFVFPIVVL